MSAALPFSIIIPCRNPGPKVRDALASVWAQSGVGIELIVVDGGSTDGTREWLESNRSRIAVLLTEPDQGIYDAMNKGIAAAHSEWLMFLGADDRLNPGVLARALGHPNAQGDVLAGAAAYRDGRVYRFSPDTSPAARNFLHHQAALYRRDLFERFGRFDTTLRIAADYDFNLRLWHAGVPIAPVPIDFAVCGIGGKSDGGAWAVYREEITVRHRHFAAPRCWWWDAAAMARFLRKQVVRRLRRPLGARTPSSDFK